MGRRDRTTLLSLLDFVFSACVAWFAWFTKSVLGSLGRAARFARKTLALARSVACLFFLFALLACFDLLYLVDLRSSRG